MGLCQSCLKQQVKKDSAFVIETDNQQSLITNRNHYFNSQVVFSNTMLSIQTQSIAHLDIDALLMFADKPESVIKNAFIKKLGVSQTTILSQKIMTSSKLNPKNERMKIKISDPFYGIPIKKLIVSGIKVWDGVVHHDRYLKNIIQNDIRMLWKAKGKASIAIMQIDSNLGYNLKDFYKILMRTLRENSQKFNFIAYLTLERKEIEKFLAEDFPAKTETESQISQASNYY